MLHPTATAQFDRHNPQFTAARSAILIQMRADAPVTFRPALHVDAMWQAMIIQPRLGTT